MNEKIELKSGAALEMTMLSFDESMDLLECISKELKGVNINLDVNNITSENVNTSEILDTLKNLVCQLVSSKNLKELLFKAFNRCLYNNQKINKDLFDTDLDARQDYFIICWEVLRYNLTPFLPKIDLLSKIKDQIPTLSIQNMK